MADLQRFLGGSPLTVLAKLVVLSLVVGVVMATLGLTPLGLVDGFVRLFGDLVARGFAVVGDVVGWLILGASVVIPVWLLIRLVKLRRP